MFSSLTSSVTRGVKSLSFSDSTNVRSDLNVSPPALRCLGNKFS